jgi:hypothetical protein
VVAWYLVRTSVPSVPVSRLLHQPVPNVDCGFDQGPPETQEPDKGLTKLSQRDSKNVHWRYNEKMGNQGKRCNKTDGTEICRTAVGVCLARARQYQHVQHSLTHTHNCKSQGGDKWHPTDGDSSHDDKSNY